MRWGLSFMEMRTLPLCPFSHTHHARPRKTLGDIQSSSKCTNASVLVKVLCHFSLHRSFSKAILKRKLAVVCAGYPATSLVESRIRICLSAAHTRDMLDHVSGL